MKERSGDSSQSHFVLLNLIAWQLKQCLISKRKLAVAFDPFFLPKAGDKTHGKGDFWSGGSGRVEKGLEASLISVVDLKKWTRLCACR